MSLIKKPVFWIGVVSVAAIGWVLTSSDAPAAKSGGGKVAKKKSSSKKKSIEFTKEDFTAEFKPLNTELKNAFMPIVARKGGLSGGDGAANSIPVDFAGGDSGWVFTGNAEIDGVATVLLENRSTGDGVYLKAGERWKSSAVASILSDGVVMKGPSGTKTFTLVSEMPKMARGGYNPAAVTVPSALRGNIGGRNQNGGFRNGQALQALPDAGGVEFSAPSGGGPGIVFSTTE